MTLARLALMGLGIATFAIFISKSLIFENIRRWIDRKNSYIGYAVKCAFCVNGWSALALTLAYAPDLLITLFQNWWPLDFAVRWFVLWGLATLFYRILWPFLERTAPKMLIKIKNRKD